MARLKPKEFDPTMLLTIQKHKADSIINAEKAGEEIGRQKANEEIARSKEADDWLKNWRSERGIDPNSGVIPNDPADAPSHLRMEIFNRRADASPQDGMKIASDPSKLWGPTSEGFYLDLEEGIHGKVWQNEGGYLKQGPQYNEELHGPPVPLVDKMKINKGQRLAMNPADIPLGDGLINQAKTQMQINLEQKYRMLNQAGAMSDEELEKQLNRLYGTKRKK